jgi:hypothetical protein
MAKRVDRGVLNFGGDDHEARADHWSGACVGARDCLADAEGGRVRCGSDNFPKGDDDDKKKDKHVWDGKSESMNVGGRRKGLIRSHDDQWKDNTGLLIRSIPIATTQQKL